MALIGNHGNHGNRGYGGNQATDRLRRAAGALRSGQLLPANDAERLADAFEYAAGGGSLDEALGLASQSLAWSDSVETRSKLIAELSRHYHGTPTRVAKDIALAAGQYAARVWPRYQHSTGPPPLHTGKPEELFFRLHRNSVHGGARWPLGWRSIYESLQSMPLDPANNLAPSHPSTTHRKENP